MVVISVAWALTAIGIRFVPEKLRSEVNTHDALICCALTLCQIPLSDVLCIFNSYLCSCTLLRLTIVHLLSRLCN